MQYFLDEEEKFCKEHPDYEKDFFDTSINEMSKQGINDRLNYLTKRVFSKTHETITEPLENEKKLGLSEAQRVILRLLYCMHSRIFRDDYYNEGVTEFVANLFETLDDLVNKAPQNCDPVLYRFCNTYDKSDMKVGDIITIPYNLTSTNHDWKQKEDNNVYIIKPLGDGKTKAHNLYEIYPKGDEYQVEFLRGTKFRVDKIEDTKGTEYRKYYMTEI